MDEVDAELLGTCGVVVNNADHMDTLPRGRGPRAIVLRDERSVAVHAARLHAGRRPKRRGVDWSTISGTSNQSDYLSHYVANHMFFRSRCRARGGSSIDHIDFCNEQRAALEPDVGGRPAHAAGRRDAGRGDGLHARDRGAERRRLRRRAAWTPTSSCRASRSSSTSRSRFFEEIAQVPRRPPHLGAARARALRREGPAARGASSSTPRPRASTSRAQQPLNNIARVTVQAMAGIFGGLQSLHTDAYDEALSVPDASSARASRSPRRTSCARKRTSPT